MDVHDLSGKSLKNHVRDLIHETGQHDKANVIFRQFLQDRRTRRKLIPREYERGNAQLVYPPMHANITIAWKRYQEFSPAASVFLDKIRSLWG